VLITDSYAAAD